MREGGGRQRASLARRPGLHVGLVAFGFCLALLVRAHLGVDPCDVLHQGVARRVDVQPGRVVMAVGGLVWWCSIPLRQRPRLATISNAVLIRLSTNLGLDRLPALRGDAFRIARSCVALVLSALASGPSLGARLGPRPRDAL